MSDSRYLPLFARHNTNPQQGIIKQQLQDFEVNEQLAYEPIGEGEHAFLYVCKRGETTIDLARKIAKLAGVHIRMVAYAGLKDKYAVTRQWFSVHLPGAQSPDWNRLNSENIIIERSTRHNRKLRLGQVRANQFSVIVSQYSGTGHAISEFVQRVNNCGVPNYFTEQRFGINGNNLKQALALQASSVNTQKKSRKYDSQKGLYLSAARSLIFNKVLSARVEQDNWNKALEGDLFMKTGRHGMFSVEKIDQVIIDRIESLQISATGPLYGIDTMRMSGQAQQIENAAMSECTDYQYLLEQQKVKADRRALRLVVNNLTATQLGADSIKFDFSLPSGCYATAVLREFVQYPGQMR